MDELIALILSTGTRVVISEETVSGGVLKRPLVVNYVSASNGVVTETWDYAEDAQSRAWGAIKSVNYQLTSANDVDLGNVYKEQRGGKGVVSDLLVALKGQSMTHENKSQLFDIILSVVVLLLAGDLNAAKAKANSIKTDVLYTNARKNYLVNRIQTEIDKL